MKIPLIRRSDFYLLPNLLSLGRVVMVPWTIWLLYEKNLWGALILFLLSALSDTLDGWIARKYKKESKLGMLLDPLADKLVIISILIMLLAIGHIRFDFPFAYNDLLGPVTVIVTVGREIAITGLRSIAGSLGMVIPADSGGKLKTWIQFLSMTFLLIDREPFVVFGHWLLLISVGIALWSGTRYVYRFLIGLPL